MLEIGKVYEFTQFWTTDFLSRFELIRPGETAILVEMYEVRENTYHLEFICNNKKFVFYEAHSKYFNSLKLVV